MGMFHPIKVKARFKTFSQIRSAVSVKTPTQLHPVWLSGTILEVAGGRCIPSRRTKCKYVLGVEDTMTDPQR